MWSKIPCPLAFQRFFPMESDYRKRSQDQRKASHDIASTPSSVPYKSLPVILQMDIEKLKQPDTDVGLAEWRKVHPVLYGVGMGVSKHWQDRLTGVDIDNVIEETIEVAMNRIDEISSIGKLKEFISSTVANKLMARVRSKSGPRSVEGKSDSLEQKIESSGDFEELGVTDTPDRHLQQLDLYQLAHEVFASLPVKDYEFVWDVAVEELTQKEIAEKRGWNVKSMTTLYRQSIERCRRNILAHPKGAILLKELNWEHHLDE
jgi:RNA polymerase sigma factor (sigma-70 family)